MSNSGNTANSNRWSMSYATTVYAILSVQNLTNHRFGITEDYISWAMDIDASSNEAAAIIPFEVRIPRHNLRSRQIFDPPPRRIANEGLGQDAAGSTQDGSDAVLPVVGSITAPGNAPAHQGSIPFPQAPTPVSSYPFPMPIFNTGGSGYSFTILAGGPNPEAPVAHASHDLQDGDAQVEAQDASSHWNNDWGDEEPGEEEENNEESNDNSGDNDDDEFDYWSLARQYEVLGESYADYLEH